MINGNRAVLYLRLSKEDVNKLNEGDDSASIINQRLLLMDYALDKGFEVVNVYSDDDESGLYDNRPDFEKMIRDAKLGMFDIIIAKSQSRFSRNMEHIEKYLHHDLPNMGVRFIGVVDNTDTANRENKKSRQINGLVNEWYCEDLSANIRSAFKAKMKNGQFLGSSCPYGYKRDPENHNRLVIDEYAASIVRKIFKLYLSGIGKGKIGAMLSQEGILIPTRYKREVLGENYYNAKAIDTTNLWSYQTIHTILNNQTYIGNLVQNKVNTLSYKDRKKKMLPKSEWIVVENTHEAIIDEETFERVQEMQKVRTRDVKDTPNGIFSGMIFCADCKHAMNRNYERHGEHNFNGYVCKTYKTKGKVFCESHIIYNDDLEEAVLESIKAEARKILSEEDIDELQKMQVYSNEISNLEQQLEIIEGQLEKYTKYKKKTYQSYMDEIISREDYLKYCAEYDSMIVELQNQQEEILKSMDVQNELDNQYDEWVERFKNYIDVEALTREMVVELIEKIEVHNDGQIDIYYRFQNPYA